MLPQYEICKKCKHLCTQERIEEEGKLTFVLHVYTDNNLWGTPKVVDASKETDTGWCADGQHCKIARANIGYEKDGKFVQDEEFEVPAGCPYILEHTVMKQE